MAEPAAGLRERVLGGLAWGSAARLFGQLINWAMTLVVLRFLLPADYGLMAITAAIAGFLESLGFVGFRDALVQAAELTDATRARAFAMVLATTAITVGLLLLLAGPIAGFFHQPGLSALLRTMSLGLVFSAVAVLPKAELDRDLRLKDSARVELLSGVIGGATVLGLAIGGYGVWSLAIGQLLGAGLRAGGYFWLAPCWLAPRWAPLREARLLRFAGWRAGDYSVWYLSTQIDVLIIGRILGDQAVAIYAVARTIAALPVTKTATVLNSIAAPAFSRIQHDPALAGAYLGKSMRLLSFIAFPIFFGITATAPEIVPVVLGGNWAQAVLPLQIIALGMAIRPAGTVAPALLIGLGHARSVFHNTLLGLGLFTFAFLLGSHWGIVGVSLASAIVFPLQLLQMLVRVRAATRVGLAAMLGPMLPPLLCALAMLAVLAALRPLLGGWSPAARLPVLVGVGAVAYVSAAALICRPLLRELLGLLRR